ncbi:UDP-N-acetylmuramate dehydrogenase [Chloroflexota bacterium]
MRNLDQEPRARGTTVEPPAEGRCGSPPGSEGITATEGPTDDLLRLAEGLRATLGAAAVQERQPVARFTSLRVGGPADWLIVAETVEVLRQAVILAWKSHVPCRVLGGGSNVLVGDAGIRGLVILNRARGLGFAGERLRAESGASLSTVARKSVAAGLGGLEWAVGIPGTVGGAVVGNAGAWGGDVASTLVGAQVLGPDGTVRTWPPECFVFGYRTSVLKGPSPDGEERAIVLEAEFTLQARPQRELEERVADIRTQRTASQPPGATCGSVFKNPPGDFAGRLIEAVGLKGRRLGGAEISQHHANFIVNRGGATAGEVKALIDLARSTVDARCGTALELEIELIGEW